MNNTDLSRERVDFLLTKFPKDKMFYITFEANVYPDKEPYEEKTYSDEYVDWLVGRELLYCEFIKDYLEYTKPVPRPSLKCQMLLEDKWNKLNIALYNLNGLVCRLVESRGD